ncbi:unnamed protein product, partial [Rhizoctonia solani]
MRVFAPGLWNGPAKIILGIDIGATQSAVAFTYLSPGAPQTLCRVQEWPGQPNHKGQSRIPTVVSYNKECKPVCFGAEANEPVEEGCTLVRHFKLHLHPAELRDQYDIKLEALPEGVTLRQIYADFMTYLFAHTKKYFCEHKDVRFVVCDAGGSTIDSTSYRIVNEAPLLELAETKASSCVQNGGVCVDIEFRKHLSSVVSQIDAPQEVLEDYMLDGMRDFEENVKKEFDGTGASHRINLGAGRKSYEHLGIRLGRLSLPGYTIRKFFDQSVETAISSIQQQMEPDYQHILLVGGFGESLYLRRIVMSEFEGKGCSVTVTNDPNAKAVADGSVIWGAKRSVIARATRMAYGIQMIAPYDQKNDDHCGRPTVVECDGVEKVVGLWSQIVDKGTVMDAKDAVREEYMRLYDSPNAKLGQFTVKVYSYNGGDKNASTWLMDRNGYIAAGFEEICQIKADLSDMHFKVAIQFGDTELKAFLEWEQKVRDRTLLP